MERKTGREMERSKEAGGKIKRKRKSIRERKSKSRGRKRECGGERKRCITIRELWQVQSVKATFHCSTCFDLFRLVLNLVVCIWGGQTVGVAVA